VYSAISLFKQIKADDALSRLANVKFYSEMQITRKNNLSNLVLMWMC